MKRSFKDLLTPAGVWHRLPDRGGLVGLILDTRGRPLALPTDRDDCRRVMTDWVEAMGLYPH